MAFTNPQKLQIKKHLLRDQEDKELDNQFKRLEDDADAMAEAQAALTLANTTRAAYDAGLTADCNQVDEAGGVKLNPGRRIKHLQQAYYEAVHDLARILYAPSPYEQYMPQTYSMSGGAFFPQ